MAYTVVRAESHEWQERPAPGAGPSRQVSDITTRAGLRESRARIWRLPPGARGRRHIESVQEETFVVLAGTVTALLGDPPERFDLGPESIVRVEPGTAIQLRNEGDTETVVLVYGAPPVTGSVEYLDDLELAPPD